MAEKSKSAEDQTPERIIVASDHGRLDLVTALLEGGADPNIVDEVGTSALHNAAKRGHWDIARVLLEKNASPRIEDGNRRTPLGLAVKEGHERLVRLFLESDPSITERQAETSKFLRIAAAHGFTEIVKLFLDCDAPTLGANGKETALHFAAAKGHPDVCDLLLKHDKSLNRSLWARIAGPSLEVFGEDYSGNKPFWYAVDKGHEQVVEVFLRHYPELSKSSDRHKQPLFHKVIRQGNIGILRIFLDHGADTEMKDKSGRRALHEAVAAENTGFINGATEMIQLLLAHGAIAEAKDKYGCTPEHCTSNPKIRMILRNHAAVHSKGDSSPMASTASAPPPEYKA